MIGSVRAPLIGKNTDIDDPAVGLRAAGRVDGGDAVDTGLLERPHLDLGLTPGQLLQNLADIGLHVAIEAATRKLRLSRRALDGHRVGAVRHLETDWHDELQPQVRVSEAGAIDDALRRIVVDLDAVELRQEGVAVAHRRPRSGKLAGELERLNRTILRQRMGHGPFRRRAPGLALHPRLERRRAGQRVEHRRAGGRIVSRLRKVTDAEPVGLIFLLAREAQRGELAVALEPLADQAAERVVADDPSDDRAQHAEDRVARAGLLASAAVVSGDVASLVAEHEREFGFVAHQAHQLARDVDIAAGDREGVFDRRVQRREMIDLPGISGARLSGDTAPDGLDIIGAGTGLGAAELGHDGGVLLRRLGHVALAQRAQLRQRRGRDQRRGGKH